MIGVMATMVISLFLYFVPAEGLFPWHGMEPGCRVNNYSSAVLFAKDQIEGDLVFVETDAYKSKDGKDFYVTGKVKNVSKVTIKKISVTVRIYNKDNKELERKTVSLSPDTLRPQEEGSFEVVTKFNEEMHGYQKTVKWKRNIHG